MIVHQVWLNIYNLDEIQPIFKECQEKVLEWCKENDYEYKLWDDKSCDRLIKKYPEFEDLYLNVRHKIMKIDVIRHIILHYYGGLYLDMDVVPNPTTKLKEAQMLVVGENIKNEKIKKRDSFKNIKFSVEVLQSNPCNNILLDFLRYAKTQIEEKNKIKVYDTWKVRYMLQTTSNNSFNRFMKNYKKDIDYLTYSRKASTNDNLNADFWSNLAESYMENGKMKE